MSCVIFEAACSVLIVWMFSVLGPEPGGGCLVQDVIGRTAKLSNLEWGRWSNIELL
jgi:hypothetical protein